MRNNDFERHYETDTNRQEQDLENLIESLEDVAFSLQTMGIRVSALENGQIAKDLEVKDTEATDTEEKATGEKDAEETYPYSENVLIKGLDLGELVVHFREFADAVQDYGNGYGCLDRSYLRKLASDLNDHLSRFRDAYQC